MKIIAHMKYAGVTRVENGCFILPSKIMLCPVCDQLQHTDEVINFQVYIATLQLVAEYCHTSR